MRALWLEDQRLSLREDAPEPDPPTGEARVRVHLAGICRTDLELIRGYYPFVGIPGHEFVGHVEAAPGAESWVGRRVVGEINTRCGECRSCRSGLKTHCSRRTVLGIAERHGAFAECLALPLENLHPVPDSITDEVAVFTEPTAAALEIQERVSVRAGDRVVVIGSGKLGNLVAQTLRPTGCDLRVLGRHPATLQVLAEKGIATGLVADLEERSADVVVECTGNGEGLALALKAVRPRGTVVLKSTYRGTVPLDAPGVVVEEVTLLGSRCGPFPKALECLGRGDVDVAALLTARRPLSRGLEALAEAERPGALKVLLEC